MSEHIQDFVNHRRWAVVGVSNDHAKFGRKIFDSLRNAGYEVVPVNPKLEQLDDGTRVFASLKDLPEAPEVVDLVIPPAATVQVVKDGLESGVTRFWFQPGAQSPEAIALAEQAGAAVIADGSCAMVEKKRW